MWVYIWTDESYYPNQNTLLYCPLKDDILDHNTSPKTITQTWTVTKWDIWYYFNWWYLTTSSFVWPSWNNTMSIWIKPNWAMSWYQCFFSKYYWSNSSPYITSNLVIHSGNSNVIHFQTANSSKTIAAADCTATFWSWQLIVWVFDWSYVRIYKNWTLIASTAQTWWTYSNNTPLSIGNFLWNTQLYYWYLSDAIFESKARTEAEIQEYYNRTKWAYWL